MTHNRPLSPHLQVYRLPLTGIISITHRVTGVLLALGLVLFVCTVSAIAAGPASYAAMQDLLGMLPVQIIYWGFVYALIFHLCHGVRHLIWDAGASFNRDTMDRYALYELAVSVVLTVSIFFLL